MTSVASLTLEQKLREVVQRAARLLPGDAGRRLLAMLSPESLAAMAVVVVNWAGSHFFGVGEIADVILFFGGIATVGMTAVDGGKKLMAFAVTTHAARTENDLDRAARDLGDGLSIIGIEAALALLFRCPTGAFRHISPAGGRRLPSFAQAMRDMPGSGLAAAIRGPDRVHPLPNCRGGRDDVVEPGHARPRLASRRRIESGSHDGDQKSARSRSGPRLAEPLLLHAGQTRFVDKDWSVQAIVHPALSRGSRGRAHSQWRNPRRLETPVWYKFPLDTRYDLTLAQMAHEARGVLLGPVVVGGATYHAWHGHRGHDH